MHEKEQHGNGDQVLARSYSEPKEQMDFCAYTDTIDNMSEIIIQYGYVPITPLLTLINNTFEMKVDAYNLIGQSQGFHPNGSSALGSWNTILGFFSVVAINVGLLTLRTSVVEYLTSLTGDSSASKFKWIFFTILAVSLAFIVAFEKWIIPDVRLVVEQTTETQRLITSVLILGATVDSDKDTPPQDYLIVIDYGMLLKEFRVNIMMMRNIHVLYQIQIHRGNVIWIDDSISNNYDLILKVLLQLYS